MLCKVRVDVCHVPSVLTCENPSRTARLSVNSSDYNGHARLVGCEIGPHEGGVCKADSESSLQQQIPCDGNLLALAQTVCGNEGKRGVASVIVNCSLYQPRSYIIDILPFRRKPAENLFKVFFLMGLLLSCPLEWRISADIRLTALVLEVDLGLL